MPLPALLAGAGGKALLLGAAGKIAGLIGQSKDRKRDAQNLQAQRAYQTQENARRAADRNAINAKNERSRVSRFNMAMGILRSLSDQGGVPKETLDALEATSGQYNPLVETAEGVAPIPKQAGFNFFSTLGDIAGLGSRYYTQQELADDYAREYDARVNAGAPGVGSRFGSGDASFGGGVDFTPKGGFTGYAPPTSSSDWYSRGRKKPAPPMFDINDLFS